MLYTSRSLNSLKYKEPIIQSNNLNTWKKNKNNSYKLLIKSPIVSFSNKKQPALNKNDDKSVQGVYLTNLRQELNNMDKFEKSLDCLSLNFSTYSKNEKNENFNKRKKM